MTDQEQIQWLVKLLLGPSATDDAELNLRLLESLNDSELKPK